VGNRIRFWSAPAERSDDGAFGLAARKSGVALRLPPQSKIARLRF
jgi:hypothetical protein